MGVVERIVPANPHPHLSERWVPPTPRRGRGLLSGPERRRNPLDGVTNGPTLPRTPGFKHIERALRPVPCAGRARSWVGPAPPHE